MGIEKILVVDDELLMRSFAAEALRRRGKEVFLAENGRVAIQKMEKESFDLVLSDVKMPEKTGIDVLKAAKELQPASLVILATAYGTIESAVEAMRLGAFSYLIKPYTPEALEALLDKAEEHLDLVKQNTFYSSERLGSPLIAESVQMKKILGDVAKIAPSSASVFITGESGTGKEGIASEIHRLSTRKGAPFVKVNCAAIPEALLESEFFGHEKGAFTGAHMKKIGRFELAHQGTLLLDEVTEIPLALQPKLLRAIQEQEFERVGAIRATKVNIRFLATSNRSMQEAIENRSFREDLYYRLNVVPIHLPPLRERTEDILPLSQFFIAKCCQDNHKKRKNLTERAEEKLMAYSWPGNVRELANIIERTVVLDFGEEIDADHLYLDPPIKGAGSQSLRLHEVEKRHILDTLTLMQENRTKTAGALGISVRTLRNKLHEYGYFQDDGS
jgi:two-component system response regulator AtoC